MSTKPGLITIASRLANGWFQARILGRQLPLLTAWNLTFHCNLRCQYCACPDLHIPELKTPQILEAITEFHKLGMRWVTFSGGEPLLRNDIGQIVNHTKNLGIIAYMSTNGTLLPRRIDAVRRLDKITISLDGPERVHDAIRGAGSFKQAVQAILLAQEHDIPTGITCVVSRQNVETVEEVLDLATQLNVTCMFQPATKWLNSHTDPNPLAPETNDYQRAIHRLIHLKKKGAPITNSVSGLRYLLYWPAGKSIRSTAGQLTCTVESDGKVLASHITQADRLPIAPLDESPPWERFQKLEIPTYNDQSWCAPILELDMLFRLKPEAIFNAVGIHHFRKRAPKSRSRVAQLVERDCDN